ncbi:uncharacterized protein LOC125532914 [Triticum urartu]|uniref:Uncharacterized protein n=2 Tax=Triticum TaxID=4564 RepID=A0A9R0V0K4_TRITD|nr:uncharacterized protein LOC119303981 [Triticum dicoccoides]XP_048552729.1 uncharacterized protein LOC125532908 [Triticum urartu]XP_048552732.1 uncharacterized protein LOC125532914 [Triticum urartu]VAH07765.1 unnamed protein product [Triticum turgidum subsp. durum]
MKTGVIILSVVVAVFGVASAVLGLIAEGAKLTPNDIKISRNECVYPDNPAYALGLVAALLLLVAQITASAVGGCCGCCKPRGAGFSGSKRSRSKRVIGLGALLCLVSWIAALIAEWFFLQGAFGNAPMTRRTPQGQGCTYLKDGVFRMGAILSILATVLGIISYIVLYVAMAAAAGAGTTATLGAVAGPSSAGETKHDGIAIGQPAVAQQQSQAV